MGNNNSSSSSLSSSQKKVFMSQQYSGSIQIQKNSYSNQDFDHVEIAQDEESPDISTLNYNDDEPTSSINPDSKINAKDLEVATKLSLKLKKSVIQSNSFRSQTFPMLVSLITENFKTFRKTPLDLICVLDRSGSMSVWAKIELVKESFKYLLNFLGDSDRLSIVIFDDRASRLFPLMRMTETNKEIVISKLKNVYGRGGTDINLGMTHAFKILKQRRKMNPVSSIFLLSDGLDSGAQQRVKNSLAEYNISESLITINTFGFGSDHDPQLMNGLADLIDGNFYSIEKLDSITEAFVDCLGGILSSIGQNVKIKISPETSILFDEDVEIVKASGEASMWTKQGNSYVIKMSNIFSGTQKDFVLELKLPINKTELQDHEKNIKVASATVRMTALDGKTIIKTADLVITLFNETEELKEDEEPDRDVMKNFYRVKGASILSEAKQLADQRKYDGAKRLLQNFKEELENSFLSEEEFIKNLIIDINKALQDVNPVAYEQSGKHNMIENARAQMYQKVNLKSANSYQNDLQINMLQEVRLMKSKIS